jgi:hypothetical protein
MVWVSIMNARLNLQYSDGAIRMRWIKIISQGQKWLCLVLT